MQCEPCCPLCFNHRRTLEKWQCAWLQVLPAWLGMGHALQALFKPGALSDLQAMSAASMFKQQR